MLGKVPSPCLDSRQLGEGLYPTPSVEHTALPLPDAVALQVPGSVWCGVLWEVGETARPFCVCLGWQCTRALQPQCPLCM